MCAAGLMPAAAPERTGIYHARPSRGGAALTWPGRRTGGDGHGSSRVAACDDGTGVVDRAITLPGGAAGHRCPVWPVGPRGRVPAGCEAGRTGPPARVAAGEDDPFR